MTENEAVERMRSLIVQAVQERQVESWSLVASRTALTSHPAVEALRRMVDRAENVPHFDDEGDATHARSVLASLPKEK